MKNLVHNLENDEERGTKGKEGLGEILLVRGTQERKKTYAFYEGRTLKV